MKTKLLCLLLIAFSLSAYCQKKSPDIEGAWKMVQYQTINGEKAFVNFPGKSDMDVTKIWSGSTCMAVGRIKEDTTVTDMYFLGTYTLKGNKYEENVKFLMYKPWEGKTIKMTLEMRNDTLIQTYPVDDKGKMEKDWAWIEKYIKIKK